MTRHMVVHHEVRGDKPYLDERQAAYIAELEAATANGERDRCMQCGRWTVGYYQQPDGSHTAECPECGWTGA